MANNGKTSSSSMSEKLLDAIEILAQAEIGSAQFDKTVTGIIISCEDEATGRYKVQYQDAIFYAFSSALDVTYTKGTSVQVKIPNNDFSGRKMIIGTVEENGIDYGTIVEDPLLRYEQIGVDCIGSTEEYDLSSYWSEERNNVVLYDIENDIDLIDLNKEMIEDNIKQSNSLLLGATIKTNIPDIQRFKGDYGIKYTLTFNDIANISATVDRYYIINIDKMSGDPYSYSDAVNQIIPFDVDNKNFRYVKKIELFAKNFIHQDETKNADIFISNIRFQTANRLSDEDFAGTALSILTPQGNYFNNVEGLIFKEALAELRIKGKVANSLTKSIEYYWFIEDLRVSKSSDMGYHKYGGRGWKCLNEYIVTEGEDENPISVEYISGKEICAIKKENSNARDTKYKCVINYNNTVLEKEFHFINYETKNEVIILADRNPNFIDSIGATTLVCEAEEGITYQWAKIDAEGGYESLRDTAAENKEYENAVEEYNKLQIAIENKEKPNNENSQALLKYYQDIIQKYNSIERRKENKIINLQAGSIYQTATYKCQAFDSNGISLGIGSQVVTNYISAGDNLQTGSIIINNGAQIFKYNAKGIAPTSEQFDNPQTILPLSFTLRNAQGTEIPMEALRDEDINWIVPIKNTMIKSYLGSAVSHDEELGIEVYIGKSLGYTINENYYSNKDNNEIELRVVYQGLVYIAKTNLVFTKDGDNGTNGTDYVLKILPSDDTVGRLKTVRAGQIGSDWLRIQLWYNGIKIYEGANSGNAITGKQVKLTWKMLGEQKDTTHNINVIDYDMNPPNWTAAQSYIENATDIAKAIVEYDGTRLVATAPIIYSVDLDSVHYKVSLKEGTGFTHVVYSDDGLTPNYDSHTPFEISVKKLIGEEWGDITGHSSLTYEWSTIGNLKIKSGYTNTAAIIMFEPVGHYNSEETNNAIVCIIKEDENIIGTLHIPIHFLLNTYGHAALNDWDGNSISLDADGNKMLLAPQGGFGKKEEDNSYTGVLLGTTKDYTNGGLEHTGIFGYKAGTRTMFLNSENGSAVFGSAGSAQIVVDPTTANARLYSNDFYKTYDDKTGMPVSYLNTNENGKGALIDLTEPQIRWGNGNFKVNKDGHITAKGGGQIAGWKINDYRIDSTDNGTGSDKTGSVGMSSVFTAGQAGVTEWNVKVPSGQISKPIAFWAGGTGTNGKFHVAHDGFVHMQNASIGSGNEAIYIGNSQGSGQGHQSAIHTFSKNSLDASANGFYFGTDGIAFGPTFNLDGTKVSNFQVTPDGKFIARNGYIGGRTKGWTVTDESLYNTKNDLTHDSDGVILSTDGIGLGKLNDYSAVTGISSDKHSKFEVTKNGTLYAKDGFFDGKIHTKQGYIAGWKINDSTITGGNITLNSNGSMSGGDSSHKWSIATNGAASFASVSITGGSLNINNKFKVGTDGVMNATGATISGTITATEGKIGNWTIGTDGAISNGTTTLTKDGKLSATEATISGNITATSGSFTGTITADKGEIGGWTIASNKMYAGDGSTIKTVVMQAPTESNKWVFAAGGASHSSYSDCPFRVSKTGELYASNVDITGKITATSGSFEGKITAASGTIGGWTINSANLKRGNTTLNANGLVWSKGSAFFAAGDGSSHPVASNLSVKEALAVYSGLTTSGGGSYVGKVANESGNMVLEGNSGIRIRTSGTTVIKTTGSSVNDLEITSDYVRCNKAASFKGGVYANGLKGQSKTIIGGVVIGQTDINLVFTYGILTSASGNWVSA